MKWLVRFFVFVAEFLLAAGVVAIISAINYDGSYQTRVPARALPADHKPAQAPTGVQVTYAGWHYGDAAEGPYLKFMIYNGLYQPIVYLAHSSNDPVPELIVNGSSQTRLSDCGTGFQSFYILPGASAEAHVTSSDVARPVKKGDALIVGFSVRPAFADSHLVYFSEPFSPPNEFREWPRRFDE